MEDYLVDKEKLTFEEFMIIMQMSGNRKIEESMNELMQNERNKYGILLP
jgi:hypothetical protein